MPAWEELAPTEYGMVWDRFEAQFDFHPSVHPEHWPGIREPIPSITYDISSAYAYFREGETYGQPDLFQRLVRELNASLVTAFQRCLAADEWLYVLDWQHTCYRFFPHQHIPAETMPIDVLPNGEYFIFLAADMRFGTFGHPWEQTACVFGRELLQMLEGNQARLLSTIVRVDGNAAGQRQTKAK